ncbi:HAD family hydrolase [Longimicrobium sp.]|jgi:histidinol-phosphate phosphatase family protein|uniref:D-glycero-alpha-D-manno-heptose-1,7-bisphosphate 7-phosphatase n=1 Tax=Longimicrobium sp. TaxID=2029185 RepID=UPI002F95D400
MSGTAAVFLDKDGTLVDDVPYNVDPALIRLTRGAGEGLRVLRDAGFRLFVVSNQSGVARGFFSEEALGPVEARLRELLRVEGVAIEAFRWCPHHPQGAVERYRIACDCRKPRPGMITSLAAEHGIDLARSWMVGDTPADVEAGRFAGCRTILVGGQADADSDLRPDHVVIDLAEAGRIIVAEQPGAGQAPIEMR